MISCVGMPNKGKFLPKRGVIEGSNKMNPLI
nr:MAG TPA: hypothetical protein [Caudoviricetes sp.]